MMRGISKNIFRIKILDPKICSIRPKYIVLLPEIPPDTPESNPLLGSSYVPPFSQLTTEKCVNAIGRLVIDYESGIHQMDQKFYDPNYPRNVQNIILPLDRLSGPLDFAWGTFKILYTVHRDSDLSNSYLKLHSRIIRAKREKYLSSSLYEAFKQLKEDSQKLTEPVQRIINKYLLESNLSGMNLSDASYRKYRQIMLKLDRSRANYRGKLEVCSSKFAHNLEFSDVENFPKDLLKMLANDSTDYSKGPWVLTLQPNVYKKFLECCDKRPLRWNAWNAYNVRASAVSGKEMNNSVEIEEIRHQRHELAKLLGFDTFADLSMKTKMAGSVDNVMTMLTTLRVKSSSVLESEVETLQQFANENGFREKLEMWDIPFWQRIHKEELFSADDDVIQQYFPFPYVLDRLFKMLHKLFKITIKEVKGADVWHPDVSYYKIYENDKEVASFFMDSYARKGEKHPGSWLEIGCNRSDVIGTQPLAYLVFNFMPPAHGKPSLLTFSDLKTLFEKVGHLLQHSLTTVPYTEVAGLTNLEWDTVQTCPYVMKSFLNHYSTIASLSCHADSGKVIPPELHESIIKKDQYMKGLDLTKELYLSALDLELYRKRDFWLTVTKRVWSEYMPFPYEKNDSHPCSFPEIFCDQYPAAYFSNLWAKMIAADIFSAFEEVGFDDDEKIQQIGMRFRETYLSMGGGYYPGEVFRKFRGRDPCPNALLVSYGLANKNHS